MRTSVLVGNDDPPRNPADHLRAHRFEKGRSGNPGGRPKGRSIAARLRALLSQEHHGKEIGDILAERLVKDALSGKLGHVKEILDRTEGAAKQTVEVQGAGAYHGMIVLVPPEGASPEFISKMGRDAASVLPPDTHIVIGRCWMDVLASATAQGGAMITNSDEVRP